ncbi:signal recognition particle-docking protein FtsY [Nannocystis sp.]|uniref:signal recognition particle-docking protein FtsY n=1 Tax=Nannocystis sp. TaxID=1962667 RepID=UPI0025F0C9C7|nr:signal recognition particle-docking protein FtsY [Nannocystis sp.]MBK7826165.1 signal recognition particle-docking protein FtsY [Nannocystis sp.]
MSLELLVILVTLGVLLLAGGAVVLYRRTRPALPAPPVAKELPEANERPRERPARPIASTTPASESSVPLPQDKPALPAASPVDAARLAERRRYEHGLARTRGGFVARLASLFRGKPRVSSQLKEEIEEVLFTADIGAKTAQKLLDQVTALLDRSQVADAEQVWAVIRREAREILHQPAAPLDYSPNPGPYVLLMIGVNGVGKTTTLGKLAALHEAAGRKVLLVAGDTFRAAAGEQLEIWSRRVGCAIHQGKDNADPSAVIFEGILRGHREGFDVVLCDTAGRLHTKKELMDELQKIRRACAKALAKAHGRPESEIRGPHDTFLVLDATIGQNALAQATLFKETMDFSGLVLTKLDGTAKGGVVLGVVDELRIPVRFIGIGEAVADLRPFDADAFCDALFASDGATDNPAA